MKIVAVFALILLAGCVASPTMQELETRAMLTGDWSAVEAKERSLVRRRLRAGIQCPNGYIGYCQDRIVDEVCSCVSRDGIRLLLSTR